MLPRPRDGLRMSIGPVLGLLFIPLIGSASDRCTSSYGRRRPFIWLLSLGVLLALLIIPHADVLAAHLSWGPGDPSRALQVGLLIVGVGLLDFCGQVCFTPLEALLSDLYHERDDCAQAFAIFSFMVSLGGCVGYLLPALDWSGGLLAFYLGGQAECLFALLIVIFVVSVLVTMRMSEEEAPRGPPAPEIQPAEGGPCGPRACCHVVRCKLRLLRAGPLLCLLRSCWSMSPAIYRSYCHVPRVMRQLCVSQLCSWMAVMSFMLFYTDFVGEGLYEGVPSAAPGTPPRQQYDEGIRMGSLGLFLQCATSTVFSLILSKLVRMFGSRRVYVSSMVSFTASALVICLSKSVLLVTAMSALTGFAYAVLQTLPYTLTCHYHKDKEVYMQTSKTKEIHRKAANVAQEAVCLTLDDDLGDLSHKSGHTNGHTCYSQHRPEHYPSQHSQNGTVPSLGADNYDKRGVGLDFAILDSTFLLSQVFPTLFMGMIVQFTESVTAYIASSAIFGAVGIYFATHVIFDQNDLQA
ncbi:solute carrier family 45 member 3 isoform X2 [Brachyhypopomus gauderio]|uniref:solute carrier family 45 member 3 isoform X2 n=1 Tax=Brachyhypopomus gauderio TaxID=698409 RepID=UPI004042CD61